MTPLSRFRPRAYLAHLGEIVLEFIPAFLRIVRSAKRQGKEATVWPPRYRLALG